MNFKIWLGSVAAYNNGQVHGEWLELPMDVETLAAKVKTYSDDGRGDYFIADHECDANILIKETSSPFQLNEWAEQFEMLGDHEIDCVNFLIDFGADVYGALKNYDDVTFYDKMTMKEVAQSLVDDGCFGEIPDSIANYIDYAAIARDLQHDGYIETPRGVFHHN